MIIQKSKTFLRFLSDLARIKSNLTVLPFGRVTRKFFWQDHQTIISNPRPFTVEQSIAVENSCIYASKIWHESNGRSGFLSRKLTHIIDCASANLESKGVRHIVNKWKGGPNWGIEIIPIHCGTPLNDVAAPLWEKQQAKLFYNPMTVLHGDNAKFSWTGVFGIIHLPTNMMIIPEILTQDFLHEISHSKTQSNINARVINPFYGSIVALNPEGDIPFFPELRQKDGSIVYDIKSHGYGRHFAFDELVSFYKDVRSDLPKYRNLQDDNTDQDKAVYSLVWAKLLDTVLKGYGLSIQTSLLMGKALEEIKQGRALTRYGKIIGVAEIIVYSYSDLKVDGVPVQIIMPLVKSAGNKDSKNEALLIEQFKNLQLASASRALDFLEQAKEISPEIASLIIDLKPSGPKIFG